MTGVVSQIAAQEDCENEVVVVRTGCAEQQRYDRFETASMLGDEEVVVVPEPSIIGVISSSEESISSRDNVATISDDNTRVLDISCSGNSSGEKRITHSFSDFETTYDSEPEAGESESDTDCDEFFDAKCFEDESTGDRVENTCADSMENYWLSMKSNSTHDRDFQALLSAATCEI